MLLLSVIIGGMTKQAPTMSAKFEIDSVSGTNVNNAQESLIPSLKLALIENLNSDDGGIRNIANSV